MDSLLKVLTQHHPHVTARVDSCELHRLRLAKAHKEKAEQQQQAQQALHAASEACSAVQPFLKTLSVRRRLHLAVTLSVDTVKGA